MIMDLMWMPLVEILVSGDLIWVMEMVVNGLKEIEMARDIEEWRETIVLVSGEEEEMMIGGLVTMEEIGVETVTETGAGTSNAGDHVIMEIVESTVMGVKEAWMEEEMVRERGTEIIEETELGILIGSEEDEIEIEIVIIEIVTTETGDEIDGKIEMIAESEIIETDDEVMTMDSGLIIIDLVIATMMIGIIIVVNIIMRIPVKLSF